MVNTTLDLDTTLRRVAELVRKVIDYEIFAILLLNERAQELRFRFQIGYPREVAERTRIKVGQGVTGRAAQIRQAVLVEDVTKEPDYIEAIPNVRSELAIPLIVKNRVIGVIDLEARAPGYFTEEHQRLLTLIGSRMAVGSRMRSSTRAPRGRRARLLLLNEIARELTSILNVDELLKRIAELLNRIIDYQMFSILLLDDSGEKLVHRFSLRFQESIHLKHDIPLGQGIVGCAATEKAAVLVPDVSKDPRYVMANPETKSELAVPLIYKDKVIGVLDLEHTRRGFFTEDHKRTITTLAAQVAIALENARLYEQIARQERRLERDLALARELQFRLLPRRHAEGGAPGCRSAICSGTRDRRRHVRFRALLAFAAGHHCGRRQREGRAGGDLRGAGQRHSAIARADRTGPGGNAFRREFFAERASDRSAVRLPALRSVGRSKNARCRSRIRDCRGRFTCTTAKWRSSKPPALPPGLFDDADYEEFTFRTKPGDMFVFFSDGILDARNRAGEMFGRSGVERVIASCPDQSPDCVVTSLFKAVEEHAAGEEAFDDQTVVAIKVKGDATRRK